MSTCFLSERRSEYAQANELNFHLFDSATANTPFVVIYIFT